MGINKRFTFLLVFLLIYSFVTTIAQDNVPNISYSGTARKYEIADITVTGVENLDAKILVNMSGIKIGQVIQIPGDEISSAIRGYWKQGLFSDVKIIAKKN